MNLNLFEEKAEDSSIDFPTSYQRMMERLNHIDPLRYAKTRNFVNGAVTYLSPYISRGIISTRQVMNSVLQKGYTPNQVEKFLQELAWREYFQRVWQSVGEDIWKDIKQAQPDVLHYQMINAVENATTGITAIDEQLNYFYRTGYMHNHIRMYIASLVCNIAKAHWMEPSKWMYYHLLDGDIASNNCSWQWVAAAFASKKYYFNQENINKYTFSKQQYSFLDKPYEEIITMPVPYSLRATTGLALQTSLPVTNMPVIDTSKPTLIYNSYNLDPHWRNGEEVNRVLLLEPTHFKKYPVSEKVIRFIVDVSKNIEGVQLYTGELKDITDSYKSSFLTGKSIISKEHPLFRHYPGIKDNRDWMFPEVTGYYCSFFSFWKQCEKYLTYPV